MEHKGREGRGTSKCREVHTAGRDTWRVHMAGDFKICPQGHPWRPSG